MFNNVLLRLFYKYKIYDSCTSDSIKYDSIKYDGIKHSVWNWKLLSSNPNLTETFIDRYQDKLDWNNLFRNSCLTVDLIEKYLINETLQTKINWKRISENPNLTERFIEKYQNKVDWKKISEHVCLTINFIEKYKEKLNWKKISNNPNLTINLIEKYKNKLNWINLSSNSCLTINFIEQYIDALDWNYISLNPNLTPEFIEKYKHNLHWNNLFQNPCLTIDLIEKYVEEFNKADRINFIDISINPNLTSKFILKYKNILNWEYLSENPCLTIDLIEKYFSNYIVYHIDNVLLNPNLTIDFINDKKNILSRDSYLSINEFNLNPIILKRNKKIYSDQLKSELINEIEKRDIKRNKISYDSVLDLLKLRIRDQKMGLRNNLIESIDDYSLII